MVTAGCILCHFGCQQVDVGPSGWVADPPLDVSGGRAGGLEPPPGGADGVRPILVAGAADALRDPWRVDLHGAKALFVLRSLQRKLPFLEVVVPGGDALLSGLVTANMVVASRLDVEVLLQALADSSGLTLRFDGWRAVFLESDSGVLAGGGVFVGPSSLSGDVLSAVAEVSGVECASAVGRVVCSGPQPGVRRVAALLAEVGANAGGFASGWLPGAKAPDVSALVDGVGLSEHVAVVPRRGGVLVVSASGHVINSLKAAWGAGSGCVEKVYWPSAVPAGDLVKALSGLGAEWCEKPTAANGAVLWSAVPDVSVRASARLALVDVARPSGLLHVMVWDGEGAVGVGADWMELSTAWPGWLEALEASSGERRRGVRFRLLTARVADGTVSVGTSVQERVEGQAVVAQGGAAVTGVDTITTGFRASLDGEVGVSGWRGTVGLSDDVSEESLVRGVQCDGVDLAVSWGRAAVACRYATSARSALFGVAKGLSWRRSSSEFLVAVALERGLGAPVAALNRWLGGRNDDSRHN